MSAYVHFGHKKRRLCRLHLFYRTPVEWGFRDMELSGFEPLTPCMPCKTDTLKLPGFGHFHALQDWHAKKDANLLLSLQKTQKKSAQNI
jgi:hypothetical protein